MSLRFRKPPLYPTELRGRSQNQPELPGFYRNSPHPLHTREQALGERRPQDAHNDVDGELLTRAAPVLRPSDLERFFEKVGVSPTGCHVWHAALDPNGYGAFKLNRKKYGAHRIALLIATGQWFDWATTRIEIDHSCRNRACVSPSHLRPMSDRENVLLGTSPVAINAKKTQCKYGHGAEVMVRSRNGNRRCRVCDGLTFSDWHQRVRKQVRRGLPPIRKAVAP